MNVNFVKPYFAVSQPIAPRGRTRGYLSVLCRACAGPKEYHSSFCSPLISNEFLAAAANLSFSTPISPDSVAYPMLKQLHRCGMNPLRDTCNLSWSLHSIWRSLFIVPIHKIGKPIDSTIAFRSLSLSHLLPLKAV